MEDKTNRLLIAGLEVCLVTALTLGLLGEVVVHFARVQFFDFDHGRGLWLQLGVVAIYLRVAQLKR